MRRRTLAGVALALGLVVGAASLAQMPGLHGRRSRPVELVVLAEPPAGSDDPRLPSPVDPASEPTPGGLPDLPPEATRPSQRLTAPVGSTPAPPPEGAEDPIKDVDAFVARNRKESDEAVKALTREAEALRSRLEKVETALERWKAVATALERGAAPTAPIEIGNDLPQFPADDPFPIVPR